MDKMAYCGFDCTRCPLYLLSKGNIDAGRREGIVRDLLNEYNGLKEEDLYCDGCKSGRRLFPFCSDCYIRKCCMSKGIENCSECSEFPCKELVKIFSDFPKGLEHLRKMRNKNIET